MTSPNTILTLTFLGTGTSLGVPVIGCDCAVCRSEDPRNKRSRASLYVERGETRFVIDTGPDFRTQCLRENIRQVDAAVYTHQHSDHMMGFDDLRSFCFGKDVTLPIHAPPETLEQLRAAFSFAFDRSNWYPAYIKPVEQPVTGPFALGDLNMTPLEVEHGRVHTVGYLMEVGDRKLAAYIPDCKAVTEPALDRIEEGVENLIIDCLRLEPHNTHMCLEESLAVKNRVRARQTWLTHISDHIDHAPFEETLPERVQVAYDGLKLHLV